MITYLDFSHLLFYSVSYQLYKSHLKTSEIIIINGNSEFNQTQETNKTSKHTDAISCHL